MTAPVSVIIPTLNAAERIGPCLGALGEALFDGLIREVILADGGSDDAIANVADAVGANLVRSQPGRGMQLAAGAKTARADWFLFLHCDSVLPEHWSAAVRQHIHDRPGNAGYFRLAFDTDHRMARLTAGWANLRARVFGLPYGDQGLLVPRTLYDRSGGFQPMPLMEDVALARRLPTAAIDATIVTSADRYERNGWLRQGASNLWRLTRYLAGAKPEDLARGYR